MLPELVDVTNNEVVPQNHSLQQQRNCHEAIYWYTLHFGSIKALPEFTDFSTNQNGVSAFTGIRCNLATIGRSQKAEILIKIELP